jgi:hypothetical protein
MAVSAALKFCSFCKTVTFHTMEDTITGREICKCTSCDQLTETNKGTAIIRREGSRRIAENNS